MTKAEEANLWARRRVDSAAREALIMRYLGMVPITISRGRVHSYLEMDDLIQAGRLGLIDAVDKWEPKRGGFVNFAILKIKTALRDHWINMSWKSHNVMRGRVADPHPHLTVCSLEVSWRGDESGQGDGEVLERELASPWAGPEEQVLERLKGERRRQAIEQMLASLSERERNILRWRFWGEEKEAQVAARLGITPSRCGQIYRGALQKLQQQAEALL